jgi:hypothetical protein
MNKILHLYPAPLHVDPAQAARRPADAIFAPLAGGLCRIVHVNFAEFLF